MLLWLDFSVFPNSVKKMEIFFFFLLKSRLYFQIVPNSLNSWEGWIVGIVFQTWYGCNRKRGRPSLRSNYQFSRKRFVYIYITILCQFACWEYCFQAKMKIKIGKFSWGGTNPLQTPKYIKNKPHLLIYTSLCSDCSEYATIFS